jgi:hypothetical protein
MAGHLGQVFHQALLSPDQCRCVTEAGSDILFSEVSKIFQDGFVGHARGEVFEHVNDCDACVSNAGLASALAVLEPDGGSKQKFLKPDATASLNAFTGRGAAL